MKLRKVFRRLKRPIAFGLIAIPMIVGVASVAASSDFQKRYLLTEWVSQMLIWPFAGEPRIAKWNDELNFEVLIDNSDKIDLISFDNVFFENLIREIERELEKSTGRSVSFEVVPLFPLAEDASDAPITIFLSTKANFQEIAANLAGQDYSDDFRKMLEASTGIAGVNWNRLCFLSTTINPEGDFARSYVMIDLEVPGAESIRCFSQAVLATLGIGTTSDPIAPSIRAPHTKEIQPTKFDYDVLSILYDDSIRAGYVSETLESYERSIEEYVARHYP